jgi:DNA repair protein RadC
MRRYNPPRVFRPQRVVATLRKDARPAFAAHGSIVSTPADVVTGLADYMGDRATELFLVLFIDIRNRIIGFTELSSGETAGVMVNPAGIFREALLVNAAAMITVHQHPSGNATPSPEDRALWRRLDAVGELLAIPVMDHLILGEGVFYSNQESVERPFTRVKP